MSDTLKIAALDYHAQPIPGKIAVQPTKPCGTQNELAMAYTPGVAEPVRAIAADPEAAYRYTAKGNLVAVVTNGSAVLGLGDVGALASKPVMEGKAVLFKRFANIDVFDIEVDTRSTEDFVETVAHIAPTFGGINLEDIAAPACFEIEQRLIERLDIPVFHDDQHGTSIIIAASLMNALEIQGKTLDQVKILLIGAGSAGIASLHLLLAMGADKDNIIVVDRQGVLHTGSEGLNKYQQFFARDTEFRKLSEAIAGADVFIGVSGPDVLSGEMLASMAPKPIIFALANPDPEILPETAHRVRDDLIMATGRTDFPNQVNNVLGFPFIFRGALDVRATCINAQMQIAAVKALSALAHEPVPSEVLEAYHMDQLDYGPDYFIPKPLDPRLIDRIAPAVARAAIESGVARLDYPAHYPQT